MELALIRRLRAESYKTREARLEAIKDGGLGTIDAAGFTQEEIEYLLPGRKIEWLINVAPFTDHPNQPIWMETEAVIDVSPKRLTVDRVRGIITFQDRGCSTRTVRISSIFTLTVRVIPLGQVDTVKSVPRHMKARLQKKKLAV